MHVEQYFGLLMARWGVFWRPLQFALAKNDRVVQLSVLLRDYSIDCTNRDPNGPLSSDDFDKIMEFTKS